MRYILLYYALFLMILPNLGATRIVFLAGPDSHGYGTHDFAAASGYMARSLETTIPGVQADVITDDWFSDPEVFLEADAVIIYCDGLDDHIISAADEAQIRTLQKNGAGIGFLHWACAAEKAGLGQEMLDWVGGYYETHWSVNPQWDAEFHYLLPHPVTRGVVPFSMYGEWYFNMRFRGESGVVQPVLTAVPPDHARMGKEGPNSGNPHVRSQTGKPEHLAWAMEAPDGRRGFALTGLHYYWNLGHPGLRKLLLNSCLWLAGMEVPDTGVSVTPVSLEELEAWNSANPDDEWMNRERSLWAGRFEEWNSTFVQLRGPHPKGNSASAIFHKQLHSRESPKAVFMDALCGEDNIRAHLAFEILLSDPGYAGILDKLGEAVLNLPAERQIWVLYALQRSERENREKVVVELSREGSGPARAEALRRLGSLDRKEDLSFLFSQAMSPDGEISSAARHAWRAMAQALADPYLNGLLISCDASLQAKAIELVIVRGQESATERLLEIGLEPENPSASLAIRAAGRVAPTDEATYRHFLQIFVDAADSPHKRDWQMGIWELSQRQPDIDRAVDIIEEVRSGAPENMQRSLSGLGRKLGSLH